MNNVCNEMCGFTFQIISFFLIVIHKQWTMKLLMFEIVSISSWFKHHKVIIINNHNDNDRNSQNQNRQESVDPEAGGSESAFVKTCRNYRTLSCGPPYEVHVMSVWVQVWTQQVLGRVFTVDERSRDLFCKQNTADSSCLLHRAFRSWSVCSVVVLKSG